MPIKDKIKEFNESKNFWVGIVRDFLSVIFVVAIFAAISHVTFGLWPPMVTVESGSMIPNIQIGDIIFVQGIDHTNITTYEKGKESGYTSFGDYGDVILYKPYGREGVTPIIHRARYYVEAGDQMWPGGPTAPHAGYITKGDNLRTNPLYDQQGGISLNQPIKKEWVIGAARFYRVPFVGYMILIPRKTLGI